MIPRLRRMWRTGWRWPLWSPYRLAGVAALMLLVLTLASRALDTPDHPSSTTGNQAPSPTPAAAQPGRRPHLETTATTAPASPPAPSSRSGPTASTASGLPEGQRARAARAARAFTAAWTHPPGVGDREWHQRVAARATGRLADLLARTDPTRVPATRVTGSARVTAAGEGAAEVVVPTDAGWMRVTVTRTSDGWRASAITPPTRRGP